MRVALTLDRTVNHQKPDKSEAARITYRLRKVEGEVGDIAPLLTLPYGFTFTPGVYSVDGKRTNESWLSQQVFAVDIDNKDGLKLSFADALKRAKDYEIIPAFAYATFSSDETNDKFRMLWVMPEAITDMRVRNVIQAQLMAIYPECDVKCKDAARLFFGGQRLIHQEFSAAITIERLNFAFHNFLRESDPRNASRNIKRFAKRHWLNTVNGEICLDTEISQNEGSNIHQYDLADRSFLKKGGFSFNREHASQDIKIKFHEPLQRVDFHRLANDCPIFNDFMQGIDVHHSVTWFIMCNLLRMKGGEDIFWKGLLLRDEYDEVKWERLIRYWKATGGKYLPGYGYTEDFYPERNLEFANLYQVAQSQFGRAKLVESPAYVSLETAEANLNSALETAIADTDKRFFVIKAQVGLGKTESIINYVENGQITHAVIAVPRHDLKDELASRFHERGIAVQVTPELPEGPWTPILEALYAKGAYTEAHKQLEKLAATNSELREYVAALRAVRDEGIIITTHARLNYFKTSAPLTIIDEDKLLTDLAEKSLSVSDLFAVTEAFRPVGFRSVTGPAKTSTVYDALVKFSDLVRQAMERPKQMFSLTELKQSVDLSESMRDIESVVVKANVLGNVMSFLTADVMCVEEDGLKTPRIYYGTKPTYPTNSTVVLLSATASEKPYRQILGDRLTFVNVGTAKTLGTIHWHVTSGLSRSALKTTEEAFSKLLERFPLNFIGYKSLKSLSDRVVAHFGSLTGLDFLKGQSLGTVGVPHLPMRSYRIAAALCGEDVTAESNHDEMVYELDIVNGYQTRIMQPAMECLRSYQRWFVNSELEQAIGRARSLRESADVHVFGNWPIAGATLV